MDETSTAVGLALPFPPKPEMLYSPSARFNSQAKRQPSLSDRFNIMYPPIVFHKISLKSISVLVLLTLGIAAVFAPHSTGISVEWPKILETRDPETPASRNAFGRLPLSFELNQGQTDSRVKFLARGQGYGIFLTNGGAAFSFNDAATSLHLRLQGAATSPRITGVDQLPGKVNYLLGNTPAGWLTSIPTYERVRYEQIYNGVDLVYYGNQRQLEYDFVIAPGASHKQIRFAFDGSGRLKLNRRGDLILQSGKRKITLLRPQAYQNTGNTRRDVPVRYLLKRGEVTFQVGAYDKTQPLVIDPLLVYSTYLGGSAQDQGNSIAVDGSGNVYIAGQTDSITFPTSSPLQAIRSTGPDAFVAKLNATGSALIYSTYLGGNNSDVAKSIAIDNAGNAYITGQTSSSNFPVLNALHPTLGGQFGFVDAFVAELNSSGSGFVYSTYLGGHSDDIGNSIAVDSAGNAYVTGFTASRNFPTANPLQPNRSGNAIFKSTDSAGNWVASDSGLVATFVFDVVFHPGNSSIMYATTDNGVFKSTDSGATWASFPSTPQLAVNTLAIDPTNPLIMYAAATGGMFKSTDGGNNFTAINNGFGGNGRQVLIDPVTPTTLYATTFGSTVFRSVDAGAHWTFVFIDDANVINDLVVDPNTPAILYAATNRGIFKSTNSAGTWTKSDLGDPFTNTVHGVTIDKTNNTVYAATISGVFKTVNGGSSWTDITGDPTLVTLKVAVDPTNSSVLYVSVPFIGIRKTVDGGAHWTTNSTGYQNTQITALLINPTQTSTLFIGTSAAADAFVTKLSAGGTSQIYSTFLGGTLAETGRAITLDASGNAYVTGDTFSTNFPTANALQPAKGDNVEGSDAFITKLNATGSALVYSTYLGADSNDLGRAIAVDAAGNAYVGGSTDSLFFPVVNAFQPATTLSNDAFVAKVNAAGSALVYSTYLGGDLNEDCLGIAVDPAGHAYVTGRTSSLNFPTLAAMQATRAGSSSDAFITKLAPNGSSLIFSTYFGGTSNDNGLGIALDSSQNIYVVGFTNSLNFPTLSPLQATSGGSSDAFVAKLRPAADVEVTMSDSPDPVTFGNNLTYTITVKNNGEITATGVTLNDTLPAGASLVSANSTAGSCSGTAPVACNIGTLTGGASATVTIVITPPAVRTITNTATATITETDALPSNNTATTQTLVDFVDVSIAKKAAQNLAAPGSLLTYSLTVKNKGVLPANVTVTDNLPAGLTLTKCSATGNGVCGGSGNNVSVTFSQLAANATEVILLSVNVSGSLTEGTVINNTAFVSSPLVDPDTSNNSSTASITVTTVPILQNSNGLIGFEGARNSPVPSGIYTINPDGTDEKLLPNTNPSGERPKWSPDGSKLAFLLRNFVPITPVVELHIINANGTGLMKVASDVSSITRRPTWSPNGSQLAYIGGGFNPNSTRAVFIANADGSGSYQLPGSPTFLSSVDWSPDGTKFLYATDREIFVMNADASGQTQLTTIQQTFDGPTTDIEPSWSPDGKRILFRRFTNNFIGVSGIYTMNADGTNPRKLFNFSAASPSWSPDGLSIVLSTNNEICTVNLDNTNFKCLTNDNGLDFRPDWQSLPNPSPTPTPTPAPTFSLSGKVTYDSPSFPGQVRLTGPVNALIRHDDDGNYEFVNLPAGQYTVEPVSIFHGFNPANRTVTITNANITGLDFTGTFVPANITGHVKDDQGHPIAGLRITSAGGFPQGITFTDADGFYSFPNVQRNMSYAIIPDQFTAYDIFPPSQIIQNLTTSVTVDFIGTKQPANVISGRVIEATTGQPLPGVRVDLNQGLAFIDFKFTDANGNFSFGERKSNNAFAVTINDGGGFVYGPKTGPNLPYAEIQIPSLMSDQNLAFTAARVNTVQFTSASASVNEGSGSLEIAVTRTGDVASPATVDFGTFDQAGLAACSIVNGKASERCDYGSTAGTLRFAAGETSKLFVLPIVNDVNVEGNETFTVLLGGAAGAQFGTTATATVTIVDNDTIPATQNPIDGVEPFVTQQYIDFLGRLPDSVGFANWVATLGGCPNGGFGENLNPSCDRVHVSSGFFLSDEFRGRGYWAYRFYEVGFDRRPLYVEFVPDMAQVGGAQSPQSELLSKAAYTDAFVQRNEFRNLYNALPNSTYVNTLEQNAEIILSNKADLIAALDANQKSRGQVLREIVESKAVEDRFFIRAFVAMQYFGYLRRDPDTIGYNNWVTTLTNDPSNIRHMIFGFLFSAEYRGRFGP
jgi:uncharacterized repeat protein (TIGR01451 family)